MKKLLVALSASLAMMSVSYADTVVSNPMAYVKALTNVVATMNKRPLAFPQIPQNDSLIAYGMAVGMAQQMYAAKVICTPDSVTNADIIKTVVVYAAQHIDEVPDASPVIVTTAALYTVYKCGNPV